LRLGSKGRYGMFAALENAVVFKALYKCPGFTSWWKGEHPVPQNPPLKTLKTIELIIKQSMLHSSLGNVVFRERELTFTFAICYRPSICRLSVVCNVRAPYSGGSTFRQYFYGVRYLGHPLTFAENFTEIVPGEPLRRGS